METWMLVLATPIFIIGLIWLVSEMANWPAHFARVPEGTVALIMSGEKAFRCLVVHKDAGTCLNYRNEVVWKDENGNFPPNTRTEYGTFTKWTGLFFVSWLWPLQSLLEIKIDVVRLVDPKKGFDIKEGESLSNAIFHETKSVTALRLRFPRYVVVDGVELSNGERVDFALTIDCEVVNPITALFDFKGQFMRLLDAAVSQEINDWATRIGQRAENPVTSYSNLNACADFGDEKFFNVAKRVSEDAGSFGTTKRYGVRVKHVTVDNYRLSPGQEDLLAAIRQQEVQREIGKGQIEKAEAEAKVITTVAEAEAKRITLRGNAEAEANTKRAESLKGVRPDIVKTIGHIDGNRSLPPGLKTLVTGSNAGIMVSESSEEPKPKSAPEPQSDKKDEEGGDA